VTSVDMTKTAPDGEPPERKPVGELQPLLPKWLTDRTEFLDTAWKWSQRAGHRSVWHLLRLPVYLFHLLRWSPRGLWRALRATYEILSDGQGHQLRVEAATSSDPDRWLKLRKERNERIHRRMVVAATLGAPVALFVFAAASPTWFARALGLVVFLWVFRQLGDLLGFGIALAVGGAIGWLLPSVMPVLPLPSPGVLWLGAILAALSLGWVGRPIGKPLVKPATVLAGNHGPLRAPYVMEALVSLGIKGMTDVERIGLLFDVARVGPGYQVDLELPRGVAAAAVMEKRSQLSAALRRELGTVWPSVGKRHEGHLVLYVADQPMATAKQAPWPLLKAGAVNIFAPAPMFTDQRGHWVDLTLAYTAGVIGAVPRMGKTFAIRELLLVAGLDPRSKVYAFDLKGTGDLAPTALFAHVYGVGDEDEEIAEQLVAMRALRQEMRRRAKVIRGLSHEECPDNKVTDALANRRELGLEPVVLGCDECQVWFEHPDKAIREEFIAICTDLEKRGPALGIIPYYATQKPSAKSIPSDIADNASVRLCFKVNGQIANDQVLGTSSYQGGLRATLFAFEDKGIAYLRGDGADPQIVRTVVGLDAPASEKVAARARAARIATGRLTGHAADEVMEREADQVRLLDDVQHVFQGAQAMHLADIVAGLAQLRPALYGHLDATALGTQLRAAGVQTATVWATGKPREQASGKGVKREWLDVAATDVIGDDDDDDDGTVVALTGRR
jgi:S-DNA-T family DNA segregation ATPase FtsK/SpoIIIE